MTSDQLEEIEEQMNQRIIEATSISLLINLLSSITEKYINENVGPVLTKSNEYFSSFTSTERKIFRNSDGRISLGFPSGDSVRLEQLSTGARCALYLSLRLAKADLDVEENETPTLPFICDDPFVHVDDNRVKEILPRLHHQSQTKGRQFILFTCHERIKQEALALNAHVIEMSPSN